jgi:amidohydrolase
LDRSRLLALAQSVEPHVIAARRHLHRYPELSFEEAETAAYVAARLREWGYTPRTGVAGMHGVTAWIEGGRPGPAIALRADMDALPIQEETGLPFASERPGVMHACGHDCHTAMLLGTARLFAQIREQIPGRALFIFQPAEEVAPGGARPMVEAGVLEGVDEVYGLHISPAISAGLLGFRDGVSCANSDKFRVLVHGRGGHAAQPHHTVDPVVIAGHMIVALQQIVARQVSPMQSAVITIGTVHGGTKANIIPGSVELTGTVRTLDQALRESMPGRMERLLGGIAEGFGGSSEFAYSFGYPSVVNDGQATERARLAAAARVGDDRVITPELSMGGEDFAYFAQERPGCFGRIGVGSPESSPAERYPLHNGRMTVDESALHLGVAFYLSLVTGRAE